MFPIPDALAAFYLTCFAVGFLFVFASLFLGLGHDAFHLDGGDGGQDVGGMHQGDVGVSGVDHAGASGEDAAAAAHGSVHHGAHQLSPVNLSTVMAFLTWFGGAGYILRVYAGILGLLSVVTSSLAGLVGGAIIFYFMARILIPGQRFLDPSDYQLIGTVARVSVPIVPERPGEIIFSKGGSRRSEGAKSVDGGAIADGTEVVIVRYEHGIAYVEPWSSFVARG